MTPPLFMLHLPVDLRELARQADDRGWMSRPFKSQERAVGFDEGKALHHLLDETFGPGRLRPFRLMPAPGARTASLYAYTSLTCEALERQRHETGPPDCANVFGTAPLSCKEMPDTWGPGRRLAFDLRARPVARLKSELPNPRPDQKPYKAGAELDIFVVEAARTFPESRYRMVDGEAVPSDMLAAGRSRQSVYLDWLQARLGDAAVLDRAPQVTRMTRFQRTRVARSGRPHEGPEAILQGELTIENPDAFAARLASGIGRHKAYGYGMLLLRPARHAKTEER